MDNPQEDKDENWWRRAYRKCQGSPGLIDLWRGQLKDSVGQAKRIREVD
jgi:hypothetical protein